MPSFATQRTLVALMLALASASAHAAVSDRPTEAASADEPTYLDGADPNLIDLEDSFDYDDSSPARWQTDGDLRGGFFSRRVDERDGSIDASDDVTVRARYGVDFRPGRGVRLRARAAAVCSLEECNPNLTFDASPANGSTIAGGDVVLDQLYVALFEEAAFDLLLGRLQTNANTRGGVFISSLSRMNSPNVAVNWTDGAALRYRTGSGWTPTIIVQYNAADGPSTLARRPLDFADDDSRVSWFLNVDNRRRDGFLAQRAFDITYLPTSLASGDAVPGLDDSLGVLEDYWAFVGRAATEWFPTGGRASVIVSGGLGYAPNTPSRAASGFAGTGDVGGVAWHVEASLMNLRRGHSVGVNYGRADAGWLISPTYRPNDETFAVRYQWRPRQGVQLELNARWREDLERQQAATAPRSTFDWRMRLTWAF